MTVEGYRSRLVYRSGADDGFPFGTFGLALPGRGFVPIGESVLDASVSPAFAVTAPWTGGAPLVVTASLSLDEGYASYPGLGDGPQAEAQVSVRDDPSIVRTVRLAPPDVVNWTDGSVELVAEDGSSLGIDPDGGDPETFPAYLNGSSEPIVRSWSDAGLQVSRGLPGADCGRRRAGRREGGADGVARVVARPRR